MNKRNLLHITHKPPFPSTDGGAFACKELGYLLQNNNTNYHLCSFSTIKHPFDLSAIPQDFRAGAQFISCIDLLMRFTALDLLIEMFGKNISPPLNLKRFYNENHSEKICKIIKEHEIEILVLDGLPACIYLQKILQKGYKGQIIYRAHNIESTLWKERASSSIFLPKRWGMQRTSKKLTQFEKYIWKKVDVIWAISPKDASHIEKYSQKVLHLPLTVDLEHNQFNPKKNEQTVNIGFLGALDWLPNVNALNWFLANVWPQLVNDGRIKSNNISLSIAGKGDYKHRYIGIDKRIRYLGKVPNSQAFLQEMDIFVAPLFEGSGVRVKIIEAMSENLVVITSTKGAWGLSVNKEKDLLIADDAFTFKQQLVKVITNSVLRQNIARNAFEYVHKNHNRTRIKLEF